MTERIEWRPRVAAWVVGILAACLALADVVLIAVGWDDLNNPTGDWILSATFSVTGVVYTGIGLLIALRARQTIGWMLAGIGLCFTSLTFGADYAVVGVRTHPGALPLAEEIGAAFGLLWVPAVSSLPFLLLLFPSGRPPSPRWRPVLWLGAAGVVVSFISFLLKPGPVDVANGVRYPNPFALDGAGDVIGPVLVTAAWTTAVAAGACFVGLFVRFRRGDRELRQQIKWLALVAAAAVISLVVAFAGLVACGCDESTLSGFMFVVLVALAVFGIPGAIAIALFRYRLYDLDLVISKALVYGILAAIFTGVYIAIVVGVGTVVGDRGNSFLTTVAAVAIAVTFQPARERVRRLANRMVYGPRATPYEVLADFSERLGGAYAAEEVLPRMASILGTATGASSARVWLQYGDELRPAATWPDGAGDISVPLSEGGPIAFPGDEHGVEVRHRGELLGALSVAMPANDPMNPAKERLIRDLAGQAGLGLRNVRLVEELRASRRRIVTAQDERAKRLERNLHDGAQQQLVALGVQLGLAHRIASKDAPQVAELIDRLRTQATDALDNLRDLARGIYPPLLADQGLIAALESQVRKAAVPASVEGDGIGRYAQEIEAAVYFCCLEALQNIAKYANATGARVRLADDGDILSFEVSDDGTGFDPERIPLGSGLQGMRDRLEALGGTLAVRSSPGAGTTVIGTVQASVVPL